MPELEPFDTRLGAAVHAFADRAQTSVDAAATADHAMRQRHRGRLAWLGIAVPVPVSILVVLVLLVLALAASLGIGGSKARPGRCAAGRRGLAGRAFAEPAATPGPATDGKGDEVVAGTAILALTTPVHGITCRRRDPRCATA